MMRMSVSVPIECDTLRVSVSSTYGGGVADSRAPSLPSCRHPNSWKAQIVYSEYLTRVTEKPRRLETQFCNGIVTVTLTVDCHALFP